MHLANPKVMGTNVHRFAAGVLRRRRAPTVHAGPGARYDGRMRKWRTSKRLLRDALERVWGGYRRGGINGLYHWIRCHMWNRYHIIDISGEAGYDWGWIDRDHALLLASFKILRDYVESEDPSAGARTDPEEDDPFAYVSALQLEQEREVRALYDWWTVERPKHEAERIGMDFTVRARLDDEDDEMLMRLIKIRQCLWT